jgi:hypothetical protein
MTEGCSDTQPVRATTVMDELRARPLSEWQARGIYNPEALLRRRTEENADLVDGAFDDLDEFA